MRHFATILSLVLVAALATACSGTDALNLMPRLSSNNTADQQQDTAGQTAAAQDAAQNPQASEPAAQEQASLPSSQNADALNTGARVMFAPVIGATAQAASPLSTRLSERARQRGLAVVQQPSAATHVLKGYFSAIADGNQTTVIYVWDVLDPSGNRLHRIQGQQKAAGDNGDGWSSVTGSTMQAIADRTIDELAAWLTKTG